MPYPRLALVSHYRQGSDSPQAFGLIVRRINDEPFDKPSVPGSRAVTIKFMIPNSRMGSVIGKGGSKIKEIQDASGARLNASEGMLPGSTEVLPFHTLVLLVLIPRFGSESSASLESQMLSTLRHTISGTFSLKRTNACPRSRTRAIDRPVIHVGLLGCLPHMFLVILICT